MEGQPGERGLVGVITPPVIEVCDASEAFGLALSTESATGVVKTL